MIECEYGCGHPAKFVMASGKHSCSKPYQACPRLRERNSKQISLAHQEGRCSTSHLTFEMRQGRLGVLTCQEEWFGMHEKPKQHRLAIKHKLIDERGYRCERCKNAEWLGKPITLELEHKNGNGLDHNRSNLELLCPNCHSQTPTWRRKKTAPVSQLA